MRIEQQLTWPCQSCTVRETSFCGTLIADNPSIPSAAQKEASQVFFTAGKQEVIQHDNFGYTSRPFVLCKGWAYRYYQFSDGRRQILSVLIPGDLFFLSAPANVSPDYEVQSVTDIELCEVGADKSKTNIDGMFHFYSTLCALESDELNATIVCFNEPNPLNRVLNFMRRLVNRMRARDIRISANVYPFPLTHAEIADATGLTPGDVNRALQNLRDDCITDLSNRELTILDSATFENYLLPQVRHASTERSAGFEIRLL